MIYPSSIDESGVQAQHPETLVKELAQRKAEDVTQQYPEAWVLGADTVVVMENHILGKPASQKEAAAMLRQLSNAEHLVYTGFCLACKSLQQTVLQSVHTRVQFKALTEAEINWYVATGEPFDKAGGYGIQGIGAFLVRKITGSYSNVVGLPVCEVFETLMDLNIIQLEGTPS